MNQPKLIVRTQENALSTISGVGADALPYPYARFPLSVGETPIFALLPAGATIYFPDATPADEPTLNVAWYRDTDRIGVVMAVWKDGDVTCLSDARSPEPEIPT